MLKGVPLTFSRPLLLVALLAAPLLGACSDTGASADESGIKIVTSTDVYADIAQSVAGPDVEVTAFIDSPSADPHSYEANSRNILTVTRADLVIENGGGYDDFMETLLDAAKNDPAVLTATDVAAPGLPGGGSSNEHVWYSLGAMQTLAEAIADELAKIDPDQASVYSDNAQAFTDDVQALRDQVSDLEKELNGTPVAITEPVPGYLIDDLGLVNRTPSAFSEAIEEGEDVSVGVLDETLRLFSEQRVKALIYNEQTTGSITEQVKKAAEDAGIPVVGVTETLPQGDDYVSWMAHNIDAITSAVAG